MRTVLHKLYRRAWTTRWGPIPLLTATLLSFLSLTAMGQTTIIGPLNGGNFELGGTFAANNWTVVNTVPANPTNQWNLSTLATGTAFTGNRAFISENGGVSYTYNITGVSDVSFYRDVTFPAGETIITLSFTFRNVGEASWDGMNISLVPTTTTIVSSASLDNSMATRFGTPPASTYSGGYNLANLSGASGGATGATVTIQIPASFAGTTQRIVFTWHNDSSFSNGQPPAAIDDILLTSAAPANFNASANGGLWSSPATWAGGVVPAAGNDITIPAGSHVMVDQVLNYRNITVNGTMSYAVANTATFTGSFTVGATGRVLFSTAAAALVTVNLGGDFTNNGFVNASTATLQWPNTLVGNYSLTGTGTWASYAGRGVIRTLSVQNAGNFTISTTANLTVSSGINPICNNFISNGKLRVDNSASIIDNDVQFAVVTNMGAGYVTAPVVGSTASSNWAAGAIGIGAVRVNAGHQYVSLDATASVDAPTHTTFDVQAGTDTKQWLHVGPVGVIGNAFAGQSATLTPTAGAQYFWNGALYTCINAVAMTPANIAAAMPMSTTPGALITIGTTNFRCVGTPATVSLTHDATTQTVRRVNVTSNGSGYAGTPTGVILTTGAAPTTTATFLASMWNALGNTATLCQKASATVTTGAVDIKSSAGPVGAGVGSIAGFRGGYYNTAPAVGFTVPTRVNLITAQGSGYTSVPTITVSGGTNVNGGTAPSFTVNVAEGRVISVYVSATGTACYSVPPTLTVTGGGGAGATASWGPANAAFPTATANLNAAGQVDGYTMTNEGYGYLSTTAPTVALSAPAVGEVAAGAPTARLMVYSATQAFFIPQVTNPYSTLGSFMPTNNRIAAITSSSGMSLGANTEVYADAPLTLTSLIDLGGFTLTASSFNYAGVAATVNGYVFNGSIELTLPGGQASTTRTFPLGGGTGAGRYGVYTTGAGASVATGGYTFTGIRASNTVAPSGTVNPAGNMTGSRGMRLQMQGTGALSNTNALRTFQLFWNVADNLVSDNPSIFVAEAAAVTGPWTIRSLTSGTGGLPNTGSRTTATAAPGPISNSTDYFFGFANNGFATPPALAYNVTRLTAQPYNSIGAVAFGGDNSGLTTTFSSGDDAVSPVISLADPSNAFTYQGQQVTGFRISTNGMIQLQTAGGATSVTGATNNFADATALNVLAPFWDDLIATPNTIAGAQNCIRYKITGTAPTRTVLVEWSNMTAFGAAGSQIYFQIQMTEATGEIRFNYGDMQMYNGTGNHRWTYGLGIKGRYNSSQPSAGQVFANLYENTDKFSHEQAQFSNLGANGLCISPAPRSSYVFTPGVYPGYTIPVASAPANDNVGSAISRPSLSVFPNNIAWDNGTGTTNLYTTRYATHSPQAVCGGPANNKDVWFSFVANEVNVTARVYASAGYTARVEVLDAGLTSLACNVGTAGSQVDAAVTGLTIGLTYYVRVSHDFTGTSATFTGNTIVNGVVAGVAINSGGSGYTVATTGTYPGTRMVATGGGANTFVGAVTAVTAGAVTGGGFDGGYGYSSVPTLTVESPDWAITGEFGIVIYAPPINDNCSGAIALTNINTSTCVTGQNQRLGVKTSSATPSAEGNGGCNSGSDDDLWYTFVATGSSTNITIQGNGTYDPAAQFWTGTACGAKAFVGGGQACLNATGAGGLETVSLNTTIGDTYWIRIYHAGTGTNPGDFDICVTTPVPACATINSPLAASTTCATPTTLLDWQVTQYATGYDVYLDAGAGPATTLVSSNQASTTYDAGVLAAGTYTYRVVPRNANGTATGCSNITFTVSSPSPLTTTPATRCGIGSVTLGSTAAGGQTLRWYDQPTGGTLLASGATPLPLNTPSISTTTNFYVSAASPIVDNVSVGTGVTTTSTSGITPYTSFWESQRTQYIIRASELSAAGLVAGNITQLAFNVTAVGGSMANYSIQMAVTNTQAFSGAFVSETFTTVYTAATYTPVLGLNVHTFSTPFNWNGVDAIIVQICNTVNPFTTSSTVSTTATGFNAVYGEYDDGADICGGDVGFTASSQSRPNMVLRGNALCSGPRVAVTATVTPPPALTLSSANTSLCEGGVSPSVGITSTLANFATYTWSPATGVSGTPAGGYTFNPVGGTSYLLTGSNPGPLGCVNTVSLNVVVNPNPGAGTAAHDGVPPVCEGTSVNLTSSGFAVSPVNILTQDFESGLGAWTTTNASTGGSSPAAMAWTVRAHGYVAGLGTINSPGGTNFVMSEPDAAGSGVSGNVTLISPIFSLDGFASANLQFRHHLQWLSLSANVDLSTDGGSTWGVTLVSYTSTQGTVGTFATANLNLTPYVGNTNLRLRFRYLTGWDWYWAIDDILLSATPPPVTYSWTGPNLYSSNQANPPALTNLVVANSGVYTVTASTNKGCTASASTAALNVVPRPTVVFVGNDFICQGQNHTATIQLTGTPPWNLQYNNDATPVTVNGILTSPVVPNITWSNASGTKTYAATSLTDASGCAVLPAGLGSLVINAQIPPCFITWNGSQNNGDWNDGANWTPNNGAPSAQTSVIVPGNIPSQPNLVGITANCADVNLPGSTNISVGFGATLNIRGSVTSAFGQIQGLGTVNFNGTGAQTIGGNLRLENMTVSNTGGGVVVSPGAVVRLVSNAASGSGILTMLPNTTLTSNGAFVLTSSPTFTAKIGPVPATASIIGDITMERWLPNLAPAVGSWYFLGSPISGKDFRDYGDDFPVTGLNTGFGAQGAPLFSSIEPERSTIFKYVESLHNVRTDTVQKQGWRIPGNENVAPGTGYRVFVKYNQNGQHKVTNTGTVFTGNLTFPALTRNEYNPCYPSNPSINPLNCDEDLRGWNLLANPYPCDINWDGAGWTKPGQMNNAIFTWNSELGGYRAYASLGGSNLGVTNNALANPNLIPSSQAFFVRVNNPGSFNLSVTETAKTITSVGSFAKNAVAISNLLKVKITRNQDTDGYEFTSAVWFNENGTEGFDAHYDVHSLSGTRASTGYMVDGDLMLRNTLGELTENKVVPMHVNYASINGTYRFAFDDINTFDVTTGIYLRDNYLNVLHDARTGAYTFSVNSNDGSNASDRFELVFNPNSVTSTIKPVEGTSVVVMPNPTNQGVNPVVEISGFDAEKASISIVDALGRNIFRTSVSLKDGASRYELKENLAAGVYMITTSGGSKTVQQKLVVR